MQITSRWVHFFRTPDKRQNRADHPTAYVIVQLFFKQNSRSGAI